MTMEGSQELEAGLLKGVGAATIKKLKGAGLVTLLQIAVMPAPELIERTGLGKDKAAAVLLLAQKAISRYRTAAEYLEEEQTTVKKITTGVVEFDAILGGGLETGSITEAWGDFQTGKTQLCYTVSLTVQRPVEEGGVAKKALVLDTENTFKGKRLAEIAEARGLNVKECLENIHIIRIYNSEHLLKVVQRLPIALQEDDYGLIIVDSMATHFRGEFIGRALLAERQGKLAKILQNLMRVAESFNLVVLVTNQAQANVSGFGAHMRPALGHIMAHACTHRIKLRKGKSVSGMVIRIAKVYDSPILPPNEGRFQLTVAGIEDVEEQE